MVPLVTPMMSCHFVQTLPRPKQLRFLPLPSSSLFNGTVRICMSPLLLVDLVLARSVVPRKLRYPSCKSGPLPVSLLKLSPPLMIANGRLLTSKAPTILCHNLLDNRFCMHPIMVTILVIFGTVAPSRQLVLKPLSISLPKVCYDFTVRCWSSG